MILYHKAKFWQRLKDIELFYGSQSALDKY